MSRGGDSEVGKIEIDGESKNRSPLVTDQMESSLALDFADVAPQNGDFGEQ